MNGVIKEVAQPIMLYDYEIVCGAVEDKPYPVEYEIPRENTGTLKSQGTVGACVACVISQIAEELYRREFGERKEMSEGFTYGSLRDKNSTYEGMLVTQALEYWRKLGTVPKQYFDFLEEMPGMRKLTEKYPELLEEAKKYKIGGYVSLSYADREKKDKAIKKALTDTNYPLLAVSDDWFNESHCIELVGWNDTKGKYKFKNSWGANYGDKGFAEIPKEEVNAVYLIMPEEVTLPFTDVTPEDWFFKYVKHSYLRGSLKGTSETTFEPNRPPTRAELAAYDYNLSKKMDEIILNINKRMRED